MTIFENHHSVHRSLRVNEALRKKKIGHALTNQDISRKLADEALSIIVSALGDNPLRPVQKCNTAKEV